MAVADLLNYTRPPHMDDVALLRRGLARLDAWQKLYGQHNPQWLPPSGDVRWMEDAAAYIAAHTLPLDSRATAAQGGDVVAAKFQHFPRPMSFDEEMTARGSPPRKFVRWGDCRCILTRYCDGECNPIYEDAAPAPTLPAPAQAGPQIKE